MNGHLCDSREQWVVSHQSVVRQRRSDVDDELDEAELSRLENRATVTCLVLFSHSPLE